MLFHCRYATDASIGFRSWPDNIAASHSDTLRPDDYSPLPAGVDGQLPQLIFWPATIGYIDSHIAIAIAASQAAATSHWPLAMAINTSR